MQIIFDNCEEIWNYFTIISFEPHALTKEYNNIHFLGENPSDILKLRHEVLANFK